MYCIKHLLLLAISIATFSSASQSQYLDYSVETLTVEEEQARQFERNDSGFQIDTVMEVYHPELNSTAQDLVSKSQRAYIGKSAYY